MKNMQCSFWYFLMMVLFFLLTGCQKDKLPEVKNSKHYELSSTNTKSRYNIFIAYPENYQSDKFYNVIYMLDGDDYFEEAANALRKTSHNNIVLVGVGYNSKNKRGRDYSYPNDADFKGSSGGAKKFLKFLTEELTPFLTNQIGLQHQESILYGHSLGGYFALYTMFQQSQNHFFDAFIAVSPNLMWADAYLFKLEESYFQTTNILPKKLYLSVGDLEGVSQNLFYQAFYRKLEDREYAQFDFYAERLSNTTHRNTPIRAFKNFLDNI
ncbi:hypothetical protein GGR32_001842 [Mesonia hippocampi]|uniref:Esterase n=1 Tax=Mesonia hippocampi TaxID=1628250 RepID=A0A840ERE3_9FLAO|nr:alpha/beta hydrolase-fold protein [Mesonia hippocampi]MBB4119540.1 hypothetical protein [Mesonia hippocampi]